MKATDSSLLTGSRTSRVIVQRRIVGSLSYHNVVELAAAGLALYCRKSFKVVANEM